MVKFSKKKLEEINRIDFAISSIKQFDDIGENEEHWTNHNPETWTDEEKRVWDVFYEMQFNILRKVREIINK